MYLQFEREDFIESELNPEVDWTYREPFEPVKPPAKKLTMDRIGMSYPFLGTHYTLRTVLPDGSRNPDGTVFLLDDEDLKEMGEETLDMTSYLKSMVDGLDLSHFK